MKNFQIFYNNNSGSLIFANERLMCIRRQHSGTFLLKTALETNCGAMINLEIPIDEVYCIWNMLFYERPIIFLNCKILVARLKI